MDNSLKEYCWSVKLNHQFKHKPEPFRRPRLKQSLAFVTLGYRYYKYYMKCKKNNIQPHMDFLNPLNIKQIYGAPIGGIGTGSIGRSFSGEFCRYQLVPGLYEHESVEANMFTVCIRKNSSTVYQQALSTRIPQAKGLKCWNMNFCGDMAQYHALYPESWTEYTLPQNVKLTCNQLCPIIAGNYKDSSLPVANFRWTIENQNSEEVEVALMFTWQSGSASDRFELSDVSSQPFTHTNYGVTSKGVLLSQKLRNMPLQYCISTNTNNNKNIISHNCSFYPDNEVSGSELWFTLMKDGRLKDNGGGNSSPAAPGSGKLAVALCVTVKVPPKSQENVDFNLVWYMPVISFSENRQLYKRFYTRYFPESDQNSTQNLACFAIANRERWIEEVRKWQKPILDNKKLPNWYKCALFNETYYIADGGTVWVDVKDDPGCKHQVIRDYGRFAYLEGHEYRMYNTYDVHFYASFALLKLFPKLQMSLQYDFADTIPQENPNIISFLYDGKIDKQKSKNSLPHDIGDPDGEPWLSINAYISHDTRDWKDLNLKFVLTAYRDYYYLKDVEYLRHMWPFVKDLMETSQTQHDHDGDGLIDSQGQPDQTYDAWCVTGASAYTGGLHLAALKCVIEMAKALGDGDTLKKYSAIFESAHQSYDKKLWNGRYYNYDCSNSDYHDSIMADMNCGHWFLRSSGFKYDVFDKDKIKSCLETIFDFNIMKYHDGQRGAVNGMKPNGNVDITSMQSEEMWVGVTDCLAALMIYEGMEDKAWKTIEGMYNLCYKDLGLAFQMPEALMEPYLYRSLGYMRALSIWSIQYAIDDLMASSTSSKSA